MPGTRLVAKLKATTAVTDIVSARIWPMFAPQGEALPYIVYEITVDNPSNHATGTTGTASMRLAVSCLASTYGGAKTLAAAVATVLSGWTDDSGCLWHLDSSSDDISEMMIGRDVPEFYAVTQEYIVWH